MKFNIRFRLFVGIMLLGLGACDDESNNPEPLPSEQTFSFDFTNEDHDWEAGVADFCVGREDDVEFVADYRALPDTLSGNAWYQSGLNISDDLFMFFTKQVTGLAPLTTYRATFTTEFVSNCGADCLSCNMILKAGASVQKPMPEIGDLNDCDYYIMNVDKGNQANEGANAVIMGEFGDTSNGLPNCDEMIFGRKTVSHTDDTLEIQTDANGELWLLMATESTFEVTNRLYFTAFEVVFTPLSN